VFTIARDGMLKQGMRSMSTQEGESSCAYRGDNGLRCALGFCISDKDYRPSMEGYGPEEVYIAKAIGLPYEGEAISFLSELQSIHDNKDPEAWDFHLRMFAQVHGLEY